VRRAVRIGASLALALVLITCTDQSVTGPRHPGSATLDLRAWSAPAPGTPPVPLDSLEIIFRRADQSVALDQRLGFRPDTLAGDSAVIRLDVDLSRSPETFGVAARAYGGGIDWYAFTGSVVMTAGATAQPILAGAYIGPGANAVRVALLPADTTVVGGTTFPLRAAPYDAAGAPITGVPIGYRLSDTTRAHVTYPTPYSATLTAALSLRDSAWVVAETPTHLKDSTRIHLVPQPAQLVKVSGDNQTGVLSASLKSALAVRVLDALGGGFKGDSVHWVVTAGAATVSATAGVTDDTGYAQITVTPILIGTLKVQATAQPISGAITQSPSSFTALVGTGNVKKVVIAPKIDTVAYGASPVPYAATLYDSLNNVVTAPVLWTSTVPGVATVDANGMATAVSGDSTRIIASSGGYADTARLYVRALRTLTLSPSDTVITAVGDSLQLRTAALDNFGTPITTGLNVKFVSASPGVLTVDALGTAKIIGAGNGVVLAKDSVAPAIVAQGSATLRVNQVTFAVATSPKVDTIGVGGQGQILATARDSNGYAVPGKTFTWAARADSLGRVVLSVTGSGIVSGAQLGSAYVVASLVEGTNTLLDSTRVVVSAAPPRLLQWAFDSTAVGNGGNVAIGLAVTTPPAAPLTVSITSTDTTIAKANPSTVTIGTGAAATSVTVYGLNSGRAVLTASDASGQGYQSRQMTIGVVAAGALVTMVAPTTFSPVTVTIPAGQYVTWKNADTVSHTATENSPTPVWDSGVLSPGQTYSAYFGTAGTYLYHCVIHGVIMSGTVIVQ
jgi:plastocyanin